MRPVVVAVVLVAATGVTRAGDLTADRLLAEQAGADKTATAAQDRINKLDDEAQNMAARYRQALSDIDSFKRYNEQIAVQLKSQNEEVAQIKRQLVDIEVTARDVLPLMQKMVDTLEQFVSLDLPFLMGERRQRVVTLKGLLLRADVSISEKYRRILEAYEIEMEYGRTLEAYDGKLDSGKEERTVEFVRLGRVSLMYRTLDGKEIGYWDADGKAWIRDDGLAHVVREALRVAKQQGAPDLLFVPVPAPRQATP